MKRNVDFYVKKRNELIDLLDEERITKQEFISRNNILINSFNLRPFTEIRTVNEGIFNYQYYNLKAKEYNTIANRYKNKKTKKYIVSLNKCRNYYLEKDNTILKILELIEYKNVEAYYIDILSYRMRDNLFEIVLKDYEKMIFHTINENIKQHLIANNVFEPIKKKSLIDSYVNKGY